MLSKSQKLFQLLKYSEELRKENKFINDDGEKYRELLNYTVLIESNLHWKQRDEYIKLMEMFINNEMDADHFSRYFIKKYYIINESFRELKKDFENRFDELSNLLLEIEDPDKLSKIGQSLMFMHEKCSDFDPNLATSIIDEANLKDAVKKLIAELKQD